MTKTFAFALYPGITPLDLVGPLQVIAMLNYLDPTYELAVVAEDMSTLSTDTPLRLAPSHTFDEITEPYALIVPGGAGPTLTALTNTPLLNWIRKAAQTAEVISAVCTGSLILGAAGLLEGRRAATHWGFRELLTAFGATPVAERWVADGKILTGGGVAAGIDMALHLVQHLAGEQAARMVQLNIEYDPQPPLGGIDWTSPAIPAFKPEVKRMLESALSDQPELLARLSM